MKQSTGMGFIRLRRIRVFIFCVTMTVCGNFCWTQPIEVTVYGDDKRQVIDGFGAHQGDGVRNEIWWQELFFEDAGASIYRVDLTPKLIAPFSNLHVYSPWFMGTATKSVFNLEDGDNPNGPEGNRVRTYTGPEDYSRDFGGENPPIAVMGPDIDENVQYFVYPENGAIESGFDYKNELGDFKLIGSIWSPLPWVKVSSGNEYEQDWWPGPVKGTPWPFVWGGNYAGGKLDVSDLTLQVFDDSELGGEGPTSSLTQFARSTAAYVKGFQLEYGVRFYAISIQNELNFEQYYNSLTYPLSSQYIAAIKAVRAEFDKYDDLRGIRLMGPEDLLGGDPYGMWQYGGGDDVVHKNLQYLHELSKDSVALAALDFFCVHGYARDGVNAMGGDPVQWSWWSNGWTESPAPGIPDSIRGFSYYGKKSWMTETSGENHEWIFPTDSYPGDGGWSIAVKIHQALTAGNQSAWIYWTFAESDDAGNTNVSALTTQNQGASAPKYNAFKHFSKYIRPGSVRINAISENENEVLASAFVDQSKNTLTIVLINTTDEEKEVDLNFQDLEISDNIYQVFTSQEGSYWESSTLDIGQEFGDLKVPGYGVVTLFKNMVTTGSSLLIPDVDHFDLSPNPAREQLSIRWSVTNPVDIRFSIVNSLGKTVIEKSFPKQSIAGDHRLEWNISQYPAGIYFVNLISNGRVATKKLVVVR